MRHLDYANLLPTPLLYYTLIYYINKRGQLEAGLNGIITRDPAGFAVSPMPIFTPVELLKKLVN